MLYKYVSCNEDGYDIENIKSAALWLNTPESFNDPFDIFADFEMGTSDRVKALEICQDTYGKSDLGYIEKMPSEFLLRLQRLTDRETPFNSKYGITCFSRTDDNILMWSHYANSHKGICLGYSLDENTDLENYFLDITKCLPHLGTFGCDMLPIEYVDQNARPVFRLDDKDIKKNVKRLLRTKYRAWEYEQEVRLMIMTKDKPYFPGPIFYHKDYLKEITFGAMMRFSDFMKNYLDLIDLIDSYKINTYVMTLDSKRYQLNKIEIVASIWEILQNNYNKLQHPDWIFKHGEINKFKIEYGTDKAYDLWKKALDSIPLTIIFTDLDCLIQCDVSEYLSKNELPENKCTLALLINWMTDAMTNLDSVKYLV